MQLQSPFDAGDWARFSPGPTPGVTLMQAHFTRHSFERHSHETYSIGLTHSGVQVFQCRGGLHASMPGDLILLNPDESHDGRRGGDEGFGYSILYVPVDWVQQTGEEDAGRALPRHFAQPVVRDPQLVRLFKTAATAGRHSGESLRAEESVRHLVASALCRHGDGRAPVASRDVGTLRMERVREYLRAHHEQDVTGHDLASVAGLSRAHLSRAFSSRFGVAPHVYLTALRLHRAQRLMLDGASLADAAAACGFADQSHFSRRFKGCVGIAPGQWLRQMLAPK